MAKQLFFRKTHWQIADIAQSCEIPRKYLEQVLLDLKNAGLVESKKGQHGGYRLARPPHQISLAQAIAAVQGDLLPMPSWVNDTGVDFSTDFGLRDLMQQAQSAVYSVFDKASIEVLVCHPGRWSDNEIG